MLVGAGGSGCPVARMLNGGVRSGGPLVVAQEAEPHLDAAARESLAVNGDAPELFFCRDLQGYGWCVRKGEYLNIGLGRLDPRSLPEATARFSAFLEATGRIPRQFPWRWRGHSYAVNAGPRGRLVDDGVLLIGDAAGLADRQSGEGIRQAVESGLLAAETIVTSNGRFSLEQLAPYEAEATARFAEAPFPGAVARLVPDRVKAIVARQLLRIPTFVRHIVVDEWFLHRRQLSLA
jgi:menaquinone-9 beta-reductase